jgi:hypothetical protein
MTGAAPWRLYSRENESTHLARPESDETYCGDSLGSHRPQGQVTDPSAFHAQDQFCTECLYEVLGEQSFAMLEDIESTGE